MENPLPPKYYHDNFEYLLSFVKDKYKSLLIDIEWHFLRKYYSLPNDAQCLFIRFTNRKGIFFKKASIKYDEIYEVSEQLKLLENRDFVEKINYQNHKDFLNEILHILTKTELIDIFKLTESKSLKKEELVDRLKSTFPAKEIFENIENKTDLIKLNFEKEVSFLRFLFFGNKHMDMTEFVLRDLGLVQYFQHDDDNLVARFETRKDAEDKWMVSELFVVFEEIKSVLETGGILDWYQNTRESIGVLSQVAIPSWEKLQLRIGKFFEQQKAYGAAIEIYKNVAAVPSRERTARCLAKSGFVEEAKSICREMTQSPINADEQFFAEYFLKSLEGKKNKKQTTEFIKNASEITIDSIYIHQVEMGAIEYFRDLGFEADFSENYSWRALFGLTFWDIIFDPSLVAFHHPFQRRPSDLYLPDFYEKRGSQIHAHLGKFKSNDEFMASIWETYSRNEGIANAFVIWLPEIWQLVRVIVQKIDFEKLKKILIKIAENIVENSRGLPDLIVWNDEILELVEIKSPNDSLSNQQLFWLRFFSEIGINARVLRVYFD